MQKPLEIAYEDFNKRLVEVVNSSGLPPFIVAQSLRGVLAEVETIARQHYEQAVEKYSTQDKDNESEVTADG